MTDMELLAEILFEVYGELMLLIIPEKKMDKRYTIMVKIVAILVFVGVIALVLWGAALIAERDNLMGIIPISAAVLISLAQIIAGIVLFKRHY